MKILNHSIALDVEPTIICEMSGNHNGSIDNALKIVDIAASLGAHAIKLQTYLPETITLDVNNKYFQISSNDSLWKGETLYSLYSKAYTPWEWHREIFDRAKNHNILAFSSVFDHTSVDFLENLDVPAYKIASQECIDLPLIRYVAQTNKPIIFSTGMASLSDIDLAVNEIVKTSISEYAILKCTSSYPANPKDSNVLTIPYLRKLFGCEIGLSDHTIGIGASMAAISHGASLIEKHLTLDRKSDGIDCKFSLEPDEFNLLVLESVQCWQSLGKVFFGPTESELSSLQGRRSLFICQDMKKGEIFTSKNVKSIRPAYGISPINIDIVLGRTINRDTRIGTPLSWDLID